MLYSWEWKDRPVDVSPYRTASKKCDILRRNARIGEAVDSFWAQKIVDALNKADVS